jgi:AcrR family transcriptional regulator
LFLTERSFIFNPVRPRDPAKEKAIRRKVIELAVREGFDGLSMQKVARAARVSPGTLYVYFEDREAMLIQVYLEEADKALSAMLENFDPGMPFEQGLRVQWFNRARYYLKHPQSMLFLEQFKNSPLAEKAAALAGTGFRDTMSAFMRGAIARGEVVRVPLEVYWSLAFAPLYQLIKYHLSGKSLPGRGPFALSEDLLLQTLELVLKALTPRDEGSPRKKTPRDSRRKSHR